LFLGGVAASMAETSILAQASGISREAFLACLNKSVVGSQFTQDKTLAHVNLDFGPTFTSRLLCKNFALGWQPRASERCRCPWPALAHQLIQGLVGRGYGDVDFAAFIAQRTKSAGITLESEHADVSAGLTLNNPDRGGRRNRA
jgi:3-hydroxyisobutyrate dehydrogenase